MIGITNRIKDASNIYVEFLNNEKFHVHPELLLLAEDRVEFWKHDLVLVRKDHRKYLPLIRHHIDENVDHLSEVGHRVMRAPQNNSLAYNR